MRTRTCTARARTRYAHIMRMRIFEAAQDSRRQASCLRSFDLVSADTLMEYTKHSVWVVLS